MALAISRLLRYDARGMRRQARTYADLLAVWLQALGGQPPLNADQATTVALQLVTPDELPVQDALALPADDYLGLAAGGYELYREAATRNDWPEAVNTVRNPFRLPFADQLHKVGILNTERLRDVLALVFTNAGYPHDIGRADVLRLFRRARFVTDTPGLSAPRRSLQAWRGAPPRRGRGLSWTTNVEVARFFARRHAAAGRVGVIYHATVPPRAVLGRFDGRKEYELVVDPSLLGEIRIVERLP